MRRWICVLFILLSLACNFPGFPGSEFPARPTEPLTSEDSEPASTGSPPATEAEGEDRPQTPTPTGDIATVIATASPTVTATPTVTPTPETIQPGPPLTFRDPAWELASWHRVTDTGDWEGILRLHVDGGTPPYRAQLEDKPIVDGLDLAARWRLCAPMPATVRVWSADGQYAETAIWVYEVGCPE